MTARKEQEKKKKRERFGLTAEPEFLSTVMNVVNFFPDLKKEKEESGETKFCRPPARPINK